MRSVFPWSTCACRLYHPGRISRSFGTGSLQTDRSRNVPAERGQMPLANLHAGAGRALMPASRASRRWERFGDERSDKLAGAGPRFCDRTGTLGDDFFAVR